MPAQERHRKSCVRQVNIWGSLAIGGPQRGTEGIREAGDQTQLTCQRAGTNSKQKDREAAKKAIESALAQFESDPFEVRKAVC